MLRWVASAVARCSITAQARQAAFHQHRIGNGPAFAKRPVLSLPSAERPEVTMMVDMVYIDGRFFDSLLLLTLVVKQFHQPITDASLSENPILERKKSELESKT